MRGVTLPDPEVLAELKQNFVVGWQNIERNQYVGLSHGYCKEQTAVGTTNGAGGRNVQLVIMTADKVVLHVLPGFWHPEDLVAELRFARQLFGLWQDDKRTPAQKQSMFELLHRAFVERLSPATIARSDWQGFDRAAEAMRLQQGTRDTCVTDSYGRPRKNEHGAPELKPICTLLHERMLAQPFRTQAQFDMDAFVDYGRAFYDNNEGLDQGKRFAKAEQAQVERDRLREKQARDADKQRKKNGS